jgi:hypothetical protein
MTNYYTSKFYEDILKGSKRSAEIILPLVYSEIKPKSIVDIGCGTGAWLSVSKTMNVHDVLGLDGDYARCNMQINSSEFKATDVSAGFLLDKKYDLAICLEVGEHILTKKSSVLVDSLTKAADVILFSAAIPGQGGTHHINEQWPDFWQKLFQNKDFVRVDCIRPMIYNNPAVEWWYRQNVFLYVHEKVLKNYPRLAAQRNQANDILLLHSTLLKQRYGLVRSFIFHVKYPFALILYKLGFPDAAAKLMN